MLSFRVQRSWRRHMWVGSVVVAALVVGVVVGMVLTTNTAEAQAPARTFSASTGMVLNYVNAASTSDFEAVMQKLSEALQTSANTDRNQQAEGWKVYRAQEPGRTTLCCMSGSSTPPCRAPTTRYRRS